MHHNTITDEQLADRLKNGESEAISLIYERYKHGLFLFSLRLLSDTNAAEDAVHETFVKMIAKKESLNNPSSLKSWLFTIVRNESFMLLNRRNLVRELNENDENIFSGDFTSDRIEQTERNEIVGKLLDKLLPQYKEVLLLREYESMSYEEIATITNASVSSVKSRLFKARKALMEKLIPYKKVSAL